MRDSEPSVRTATPPPTCNEHRPPQVYRYNRRAILMECTELPPYSDAVRHATGLSVFDAITCCDFFISSCTDNVRFCKGAVCSTG